jgi:hypothetical protein
MRTGTILKFTSRAQSWAILGSDIEDVLSDEMHQRPQYWLRQGGLAFHLLVDPRLMDIRSAAAKASCQTWVRYWLSQHIYHRIDLLQTLSQQPTHQIRLTTPPAL